LELSTGVHNFKEKIFDEITITPSASGKFFQSTNFYFQDAPDYTSYARIFKAYQICGVKIKYVLENPRSSSTSGTITDNLSGTAITESITNFSSPSACMIYDPTDAVVPTSMAQMLETKGGKLRRVSNGIITKYIKPKPLVKLYNGTLDTDYKIPNANKNTWIATSEVDLQHYCLKEGWVGLDPSLVYKVSRIRTYYFRFKIPQ